MLYIYNCRYIHLPYMIIPILVHGISHVPSWLSEYLSGFIRNAVCFMDQNMVHCLWSSMPYPESKASGCFSDHPYEHGLMTRPSLKNRYNPALDCSSLYIYIYTHIPLKFHKCLWKNPYSLMSKDKLTMEHVTYGPCLTHGEVAAPWTTSRRRQRFGVRAPQFCFFPMVERYRWVQQKSPILVFPFRNTLYIYIIYIYMYTYRYVYIYIYMDTSV